MAQAWMRNVFDLDKQLAPKVKHAQLLLSNLAR